MHLFVATGSRKYGSNLLLAQLAEVLPATQHTDRHIVLCELSLGSACLHCFDSMIDESVAIEPSERLVMLLEVRLGRLALVTDGHRHVLEVVAGWARLEQVCAGLVDGTNEKTDSEGPLGRMAGLGL